MGIQLRFLGTSASEGIPDPFCDCTVCNNARERGGREIRMRSSFRVTDDVQIDFGPDTFSQSVFFGNDLRTLKHLLITHAHDDHFAAFELELPNCVHGKLLNELNVYLVEDAFDMITAFDALPLEGKPGYFVERLKGIVRYERLKYNQAYIIGDTTVTPIKSNHTGFFNSAGANYLMLLPDGKKMLYAVDTGYYPGETLERLKNERLDFLVLECTYGHEVIEPNERHLNIPRGLELMKELYANKTITDSTQVYMTHFNHRISHEEAESYYRGIELPYSLTVAYDGLRIQGI